MQKTIVKAVIEQASDGFFGAYCIDYPFTGGGETAEDAKKDMLFQMKWWKESAEEDGHDYPTILDELFEIEYQHK